MSEISKHEDRQLLLNFLNRTFFKDFRERDKSGQLFGALELQLFSRCTLNCTYCYYNDKGGHGKKLNPTTINDLDVAYDNIKALLRYFEQGGMFPTKIDLFSGEFLIYDKGWDIVTLVADFYKNNNINGHVTIPTNYTFIMNDDSVKRYEELLEYYRKYGIMIALSTSIDGKFMDIENRPLFDDTKETTEHYTDEYYDKIFAFNKKHGMSFHPMVYHNKIEHWIDNFNWFQEMFKKHDMRWDSVYLLEVRNDGWTKENVQEYVKFYKYVLEYMFDKVDRDREQFIHTYLYADSKVKKYNYGKMNMFNNIGTIGRGIGCSMQTTMQVRTSDLNVTSCHRQSYDGLNGFRFVKEGDSVIDIEPLNLEYYMATMSLDTNSLPYCETCLIKHLCSAGCPGSQLEVNKDSFTPIQSVCLLEHGKLKAQVEFLDEHGMLDEVIELVPKKSGTILKTIRKYLNDKEN